MGLKQSGNFNDNEMLGPRLRAALQEAGSMIGAALVKRACDGMLSGTAWAVLCFAHQRKARGPDAPD